jgi:hypothetical protein
MFKMPRIVVSALSSLFGYNIRLEITLFSRNFSGEGTVGYMVYDSTENKGQKGKSSDPDWHLAKLR